MFGVTYPVFRQKKEALLRTRRSLLELRHLTQMNSAALRSQSLETLEPPASMNTSAIDVSFVESVTELNCQTRFDKTKETMNRCQSIASEYPNLLPPSPVLPF